MGERGQQIKSSLPAQRNWENSEFPILCEGCLGDNPYVRMLIDRYGGSCKMCERPFTIFKWRPGRGEGYRKTEVCQVCSRTKNLCQTCLLDMQLGLPSQLRDAVLAHVDGAIAPAESDVNKEFIAQRQLALLDESNGGMLGSEENDKLIRMARAAVADKNQTRVSIPQLNAIINNKRTASEAGLTEQPKIDLSTLDVNLDRLPTAMRDMIQNQHKGNHPEEQASTLEPEKVKAGKEKKKKGAFAPRPPAGPPPTVTANTSSTAAEAESDGVTA